MSPPLQSNEIRFDTLRGPGRGQVARWRTDERGRLVWTEPTSIAVVWLFANGSLFLWIAWSMWGTNRILSMGGSFGFAFDSLYVVAPALSGLFFGFRAVQRAVARRRITIDTHSAICTAQLRALARSVVYEVELSGIRIEVVSLIHVQLARYGVTRTPRHHVVFVTPTGAFQVEQHDAFLNAQRTAESMAAQLGITQGTGYADGVASTLRAFFRGPF